MLNSKNNYVLHYVISSMFHLPWIRTCHMTLFFLYSSIIQNLFWHKCYFWDFIAFTYSQNFRLAILKLSLHMLFNSSWRILDRKHLFGTLTHGTYSRKVSILSRTSGGCCRSTNRTRWSSRRRYMKTRAISWRPSVSFANTCKKKNRLRLETLSLKVVIDT
jgi:hypothetical protein